MYRQGDVLLIPVPSISAEAAPNLRQDGPIVLAYGEASGHAHVIADREVQVWQHRNVRYLRVPEEGAAVTHETHRTIDLAPGHYEVRIQREYAPGARAGYGYVKD